MNTSRKMLCLFLFVGLFSVSLSAQRVMPTVTGDSELRQLLELTPEQTAQIEALEAETETKLAAQRELGATARQDAKATRQAHSRSLKNILSPEQQTQLRDYRTEQRAARQETRQEVDWEGMRAELKTYQETNIEPVVRAQRAKLEPKLSPADRATLATLREELAAKRAEQRANRQERMRDAEGPAGEMAKPARRRARGAGAGPLDVVAHDQVAELAAKYGEQINSLFNEIAPQREQWEADKAAIRTNYLPEDQPQRASRLRPEGEKLEKRNITFLLMKTEK